MRVQAQSVALGMQGKGLTGEASSQEGENYSVPHCVFSMHFRDVNLHIEHYSANPNLNQCISTCA